MTDTSPVSPSPLVLPPGHSMIVVGPSGTGKSSLLRKALKHYGSGIILLAPGADEASSYSDLYDQATWVSWNDDGTFKLDPTKPYVLASFDDDDYFPSLPNDQRGTPTGISRAVSFMRGVRGLLRQDLQEGRPPRWAVLGVDTLSGFNQMANNKMLARMGLPTPPPAMSPEGSTYYTGIANSLVELSRACKALRGLGLHWLTSAHVVKRDVDDVHRGDEASGKTQVQALFTGAFRNQVFAMFDLVFFAAVGRQKDGRPTYNVTWQPDYRRQAKSRLGSLAAGSTLPNDWGAILEAIQAARHDD